MPILIECVLLKRLGDVWVEYNCNVSEPSFLRVGPEIRRLLRGHDSLRKLDSLIRALDWRRRNCLVARSTGGKALILIVVRSALPAVDATEAQSRHRSTQGSVGAIGPVLRLPVTPSATAGQSGMELPFRGQICLESKASHRAQKPVFCRSMLPIFSTGARRWFAKPISTTVVTIAPPLALMKYSTCRLTSEPSRAGIPGSGPPATRGHGRLFHAGMMSGAF